MSITSLHTSHGSGQNILTNSSSGKTVAAKGILNKVGRVALLAPFTLAFSTLDQKDSMISVAARDGIDSSGRVYQEFDRNKYGGVESLVNEGSAILIWGFGIAFCKSMYDSIIPRLSKGHILFPGMNDLSILPQEKSLLDTPVKPTQPNQEITKQVKRSFPVQLWNQLANQPGWRFVLGHIGNEPDAIPDRELAHVLDKETVQRYFHKVDHLPLESLLSLSPHSHAPESGEEAADEKLQNATHSLHEHESYSFQRQKEHFMALVSASAGENQPLIQRYMRNSLLKLLVCTTIPSVALGVLVPLILHWITPKMVERDEEKKTQKRNLFLQRLRRYSSHSNAREGENTTQTEFAQMASSQPVIPMSSQSAFAFAHGISSRNWQHHTKEHSLAANNQIVNTQNSASQNPATAVQFRGVENVLNPTVSWLLARDVISTLLFVDLPLSGGRVYTARNSDERKEILFREAVLIAVLFWAQRAIQDRINKLCDEKLKGHTGVETKALYHLNQKYGAGSSHNLSRDVQKIAHILPFTHNSASSLEDEKRLVTEIRRYFSDERASGERNLLFDLAELSGHIPTLGKGNSRYTGAKGVHYIDLTQKINTAGVRELARYLEELYQAYSKAFSANPAENPAATDPHSIQPISDVTRKLQNMLARNAGLKVGSFTLSSLICWGIVSYAVPHIQHMISYHNRGDKKFPGLDKLDAADKKSAA